MSNSTETVTSYKQLPEEIFPPTKSRHIKITILGTVILIFFCNLALLWYLSLFPVNRGYWLVKQKWDILLALESPVDWLILGDSSVNQGISPDVLRAELGESSINLGTVADMVALDDVWMLHIYINKFGPPKNVLIVHTYDMWHRDIQPVFIGKTPLPWGSWQQLPPHYALTRQQAVEIFLARYFPLYADNVTLQNLISKVILGKDSLFIKRFMLDEKGFMPVIGGGSASSDEVRKDAALHIGFVTYNEFHLSAVNEEALAEIVHLAEQYDMNIYIANSPVYEGVAADENFQAYYGQMKKALGKIAAQSDHIFLLETLATFPEDQMQNVDHVILTAAQAYTKMLAAEIKSLREAAR